MTLCAKYDGQRMFSVPNVHVLSVLGTENGRWWMVLGPERARFERFGDREREGWQDAGMTYDDVVGAYFAQPATPYPVPVLPTSPARRLRDALEPVATQGWWSRPPMERLASLGLGFFESYLWGRAAALGTPAASVVTATFGVFEHGLVSAVYVPAVATASRDDVLAARADGASEAMEQLVNAADAAAVAGPLLSAIEHLDGMARPLFSALRELPLPTSPQGRLWRAAELVREHRGDGHLAATIAAGLDAVEANVFTELWLGYSLGEYSGSRGWSTERIAAAVASLEARGWMRDGALTADGVRARLQLETDTDDTQSSLVALLGSGIDELIGRAAALSERVMAAVSFPPDPRKRAAG